MSTITPNMGLIKSTVAVDSGLNWENNLNASEDIIDQHNHAPGSGVQIQPSGLNINADLPIQNNNLTTARSVRFNPQVTPLAGAADVGCVYESGADLYYNDGNGNQIRITQSGSVVGSAGTITGLPSGTASASYSAGTFVFQSATSTPANIDGESFIFRNNVANSKGLTLSPPSAMASNFGLTLPSIPGLTSFLQIDTSGNITGGPHLAQGITASMIANQTITNAQIATGTINSTQIADNTITTTQISPTAGILQTQMAENPYALTSSSNTFTWSTNTYTPVNNLSINLTVAARLVAIELIPAVEGTNSFLLCTATGGFTAVFSIGLFAGATLVAENVIAVAAGTFQYLPLGGFRTMFIPATGTYDFSVQVRASAGTIQVNNAMLSVYQL